MCDRVDLHCAACVWVCWQCYIIHVAAMIVCVCWPHCYDGSSLTEEEDFCTFPVTPLLFRVDCKGKLLVPAMEGCDELGSELAWSAFGCGGEGWTDEEVCRGGVRHFPRGWFQYVECCLYTVDPSVISTAPVLVWAGALVAIQWSAGELTTSLWSLWHHFDN